MWHLIHHWPFQIWTLVNLVKPLQYGDIHASPPGDCSNQQIGEMFHNLSHYMFSSISCLFPGNISLIFRPTVSCLFPGNISLIFPDISCLFSFNISLIIRPTVSCVFPGNASWFHFWFSSRLCCCRSASGLVTIPDICHFFTLAYFKVWKILHSKVRKFATKIASRRNSVNHHTVCKITHCV